MEDDTLTLKTRLNVYGRRHIHDHIRTLAAWQVKRDPNHSISEEYDRLLVAGIKAIYNQDVPLNLEPDGSETPPAPAVAQNG